MPVVPLKRELDHIKWCLNVLKDIGFDGLSVFDSVGIDEHGRIADDEVVEEAEFFPLIIAFVIDLLPDSTIDARNIRYRNRFH